MTKDFDSVYIYDENLSNKEVKQDYIIYDPNSKCLPQYIVHFTVDNARYR